MNLSDLISEYADAVPDADMLGHLKDYLRPLVSELVEEELLKEKSNSFALVSVRENDSLAQALSRRLKKPLVDMERQTFSDGEKKVIIRENLGGKHVYVLATMGPGEDPDISLANTLKVITTLHTTCKVPQISLVAPCLWYQAQDKAHARREPISVRNVADDMIRRGMNHIMVCCLHSEQVEIAFESFDHLKTEPIFADYLEDLYKENKQQFTLVAPDEGGVRMREELQLNLSKEVVAGQASAIQLRSRDKVDSKDLRELIGDVEGKAVVILDDMIRTGSTMFNAATAAKQAGATKVIGIATHFFGFSSSKATFGQRLVDSSVDELIVTNSRGEALARVQDGTLLRQCMTVIDISPYLAKAIRSYHVGDTVKEMLKEIDRSELYTVAHKAEGKTK